MKKCISLFLVLMLFGGWILPLSVSATEESGVCGPNLTWSLEFETLVIRGTGPMYDYTVDESAGEAYNPPPWHNFRLLAIQSIKISEGVTSVGKNAFCGYPAPTSCIIAGSVETIGERAFYQCKNLERLTLKPGVKAIGREAFSQCRNLEEIVIPSSVKTIGERAFAENNRLADLVISEGVTTIEKEAFTYCNALKKVTIPGSVQTLGEGAFYWCKKLAEVTLNTGLEKIGKNAFAMCFKLKKMDVPETVTTIDSGAFPSTSTVNIPASGTTIAVGAFSDEIGNCKVIVAKDNPKYSSANGVLYNKERTILYTIPNSITILTKDMEFVIPDSVVEIGENAFARSDALMTVAIPDSVQTIGDRAFLDANIRQITLPDGVKEIGEKTFSLCGALKSVNIPESVTRIHKTAFDESPNVTIYGKSGSYAQSFAKKNGLPFVDVNHTHTFGKWMTIKTPTCTDEGEEKRICSQCEFAENRTVKAAGHTWKAPVKIVEATLTDEGLVEKTCEICQTTIREKTPCLVENGASSTTLDSTETEQTTQTKAAVSKVTSTTEGTIEADTEKESAPDMAVYVLIGVAALAITGTVLAVLWKKKAPPATN